MPHAARPRRTAPRILRDRAGASAIEFALVLPIMLALWAGMAEMANAIDNWRKVTQLARTVADLTSQGDVNNPMATATMSDILASSTAVLRPFSSMNTKIVISALEVNLSVSTTNPKVCSSVSTSNNTYARSLGLATDLSIPTGMALSDGQRYILSEVSMSYTPMIGTSLVKLVGGMNGSITLRSSFAWPTRGGASYNSTYTEVILPGGVKCP